MYKYYYKPIYERRKTNRKNNKINVESMKTALLLGTGINFSINIHSHSIRSCGCYATTTNLQGHPRIVFFSFYGFFVIFSAGFLFVWVSFVWTTFPLVFWQWLQICLWYISHRFLGSFSIILSYFDQHKSFRYVLIHIAKSE